MSWCWSLCCGVSPRSRSYEERGADPGRNAATAAQDPNVSAGKSEEELSDREQLTNRTTATPDNKSSKWNETKPDPDVYAGKTEEELWEEVKQLWVKVHQKVNPKGQEPRESELVVRRTGWKTVRIFVSSTFKDFHAEREILIKEVFPELRLWCENRKIHLVDCDLRWGVPKDSPSEVTLRTCLGEIDRCYEDNIMPFFLNLTSEYCGWIPSAEQCPEHITAEYDLVQGLSVSEMEIIYGAYRIDNPNSLFMVRNPSFFSSLGQDSKANFIDNPTDRPRALQKLEILKQNLKERMGSRVKEYNVEYAGVDENDKVKLDGLHDDLAKEVFNFFQGRIEKQYPLPEVSNDPYQQTKEAHQSFVETRRECVLGRKHILEEIQSYVTAADVDTALVISGGAGSGKTSIMARSADVLQKRALSKDIPGEGDLGWHVFYHFVGAVPGSTDLELCLRRLLKELDAFTESAVPKSQEECCQLTLGVLSHSKTRPVIVIVDAINQFDDDDASTILSWLPRKLPSHVRVILSMIGDTPPHKDLLGRPSKPKEIQVTPLEETAKQEIITDMLGRYNKRLHEEQMKLMLAKKSSDNPLWLSIACEELRVFGIFEKVTEKIEGLADGILGLLDQVFDRFEKENGNELLVATLCLLECSAKGLLETELLLLLGNQVILISRELETDKGEVNTFENRLPASQWAMVYRALKPFIRPFGDSGEGRLDFYHRTVSKAVRKKYFEDKDISTKSWWHAGLADYFQQTNSLDRKIEELPIHLLAIGHLEKLQEFLTDWKVFDELYRAGYSSTLLKYWRQGSGEEWQDKMISVYSESVEQTAADGLSKEGVARRYEQVSRVTTQSGKHLEAFALLQKAMKIEENELDARPERMVELYGTACTIFVEKMKLHVFVNPDQMDDLRPALEYARKSIAIRETLPGNDHKVKLGRTLVQLAGSLRQWKERGGDETLGTDDAAIEGKAVVERAINIFEELGDEGSLVEAFTTQGLLQKRGSPEQAELYQKALDLSLNVNGENSASTCRIYQNLGIMNEDSEEWNKAFHYFKKARDVAEEVYGYHHSQTKKCRDVLEDPIYEYLEANPEEENSEET